MHKAKHFFLVVLLLGFTGVHVNLQAKDFGIQGHTFAILEPDLLATIQAKLAELQDSDKLKDHQAQIQKKVQQSIHKPLPVTLEQATECRSHEYDPSLVLEEDIKDHKGNVIAASGTVVSPLKLYTFGTPLLFVDGNDAPQVQWATGQVGKIILTNGMPLKLAKDYNRAFYFDQGAALTKKFDIRAIPARVSQKGKVLLVEELNLEQCQ